MLYNFYGVKRLPYSCIALLILLGFFVLSLPATAQNQLVLLKRGKVLARFTEGETMKFKMKDNSIKEEVAIQFTDVSIVTLGDTVAFTAIEKIHVGKRRKASAINKAGTILMIAGIGYFVIDGVNTLFFVEGQKGLDEGVVTTSIILTSVGAACKYIRNPYQKLRGISVRKVDPTSRYYKYD